MKTFEEKWTAWIDGQLTGKELAEFEASLPDLTAARREKQEARQLGTLLRQELTHAMTNEEFFSHQLREEIERETRAAAPQSSPAPVRESWWSLGRLVWTGAASLAVLAVSTFFLLRDDNVGGQSAYFTQVLNARITDPAASPDATISIFESKDEKATVLWVEGLQSLPSEYAAK